MSVDVVEFTDPSCPFAWSSEPMRLRMRWRYGDALQWSRRMVVLWHSADAMAEHGMTTAKLAHAWGMLAEKWGMPFDTTERSRLSPSAEACRLVVAARLHAPEREDALLRALRVSLWSGGLLDDPSLHREAAAMAGLDADELLRWAGDDDVLAAADEDARAARSPKPAALALDEKLAGPEGERRYTCPSYELDGDREVVPGMWPSGVYDVALANVAPSLEPRPAPDDVTEVLRWAPYPVATQEVATICDLSRDEAREKLVEARATEHPLGTDALWTA